MKKKNLIKQLYKGNKFNFTFSTFAAIFEALAFIIISIKLEKVMTIIDTKNLNNLYKQGVIFLILLLLATVIYLFLMIELFKKILIIKSTIK